MRSPLNLQPRTVKNRTKPKDPGELPRRFKENLSAMLFIAKGPMALRAAYNST